MATFKFFEGNRGIYAYNDLSLYDRVSTGATSALFQYNGDDGPFNPDWHPKQISFEYSGRTVVVPEDGPNQGVEFVTGGVINTIRYLGELGNTLLEVTDVGKSLAVFETFLFRDKPWEAFQFLSNAGNTYVGSNDSGRDTVDDEWDGDEIHTGAGNDIVKAKGGDDYISDNGGADIYKGGAGWDDLDYSEAFYLQNVARSGIQADLAAARITGFDGLVDTVTGVESVRGTFMNDTFYGNDLDNQFMGLAGNDFIDGRGGFDVVSYRKDGQSNFQGGFMGIRADLRVGTVRDGWGNTDTLVNVEGVIGSDLNDVIIDNKFDNYLRGRDGNDVLSVGKGDDFIEGNAGADQFIFRGSEFGNDIIEDFRDNQGDKIWVQAASAFGDLTVVQSGEDTEITFGASSIRLYDVDATSITASDFIFS